MIYLIVTRSDITFVVGELSRFMHQLRKVHWTAVLRILDISKALLKKICCIRNMNMFVFLAILTQDMLVIREIGSSLLANTYSLEAGDMEEKETRCF